MNRKWKWQADWSRGSRSSSFHRSPRRIVAPERLESRNAPGVMLPLFGSLLEVESEQSEKIESPAAVSREVYQDFRVDQVAPAHAGQLRAPLFVESFTTEQQAIEITPLVSIPQLQVPYEIAVLDAAFDLLSRESGQIANLLPPPLIQPVLPEAETSFNSPESTPPPINEVDPPNVGNGFVSEPTATGNLRSDMSAPPPEPQAVVVPLALPATLTLVAQTPQGASGVGSSQPSAATAAGQTSESAHSPVEEMAPPMIQPVISDPTSKYNHPNFTGETPVISPPMLTAPPMIQPVISDPASEYNDPGFTGEPTSAVVALSSESSSEQVDRHKIATLETLLPVLTVVEPVIPQATPLAAVPPPAPGGPAISTLATPDQLSAAEVKLLLDRASSVTASEDAIIAIVDRGGRILGVHVEQGVLNTITDEPTLVFAIDGAIAKARTAAFFSNDQAALTSRTVRFISQSTITQREIEANPNSLDPEIRGPGFVAPIGLG